MINVKTFVFNSFQVNTYLLYDSSREAVIIDPACNSELEFKELSSFIADNNLQLSRIINTHGHIDHIVGVAKVAEYYNIPFSIHDQDSFLLETAPQSAAIFGFEIEKIKMPETFISEGDVVTFGNSSLKTLHIPGHSPGSIVYYSEESGFAIVGDVLFSGSIGRTDLPGGNYDSLISGIKKKLFSLPPITVIYSGHGPSTTIKQEHDTNPFLI